MKRHALSLLIVTTVAIGLIDPYACVQHSSGSPIQKDVPARERSRVRSVARRVLGLLPAPRGYALDPESVTSEASATAPWSPAGTWAAPATARADRSYAPPDPDAPDAAPTLEQRVFVNAEVALPTGLASESGALREVAVPGAAAVEVLTAGVAEEGGRLAMPLTPDQADRSLTIVRILLADAPTERAFRAAARSGEMRLAPRKPPSRAGRVETLVVELYGARGDVERLAKRLPVAALRRLLDR